ncbi:MAG: ATP-dependent RecD-like DNA helicase [Ignavibacteria bacterium]|nr:MAG: ATP-dependent RecD-like DNA helicase [Ignavibacteria bacterium]
MNAQYSGHDRRKGSNSQPETLEGTLERISWSAPDSGFVVARFRVEGELFPVVAVGEMFSPSPGDRYVLHGNWQEHAKYGKQFQFQSYDVQYPATREGIARYLASGLIRGIGKSTARKIVDHFGTETLTIMNEDIERLREVAGIGDRTLDKVRESWEKQRGVQNVMVFLKSHDISTTWAVRIFREYGADSVRVMQEDPYRLVVDIEGIGFVIADGIARSLGVEAQDERRILAGVGYVLREAARRDGHIAVPEEQFVRHAASVLEIDEHLLMEALRRAKDEGLVIGEDDMLFPPELYHAEVALTRSISAAFAEEWNMVDHRVLNDVLESVEENGDLRFNAMQVEAVHKAIAGPLCILTGGPGTGKTTTLRGVLEIARRLKWKTAICAPTGRAAKRIQEVTGFEAFTIHRLLEFDPVTMTFQRHDERPVEADLLVVDEMSMVDLPLMAALLRARRPGCRVVLVGDENQLPSVGPGAVLRDLIGCGEIETVVLTLVFRQSVRSSIISNAHRVREGYTPVFDSRISEGGETFFRELGSGENVADVLRELVTEQVPGQLHCDPVRDIQVLSPMHGSAAGVTHLNHVLQRELNGSSRVVYQHGEKIFRANDKVMQVRNNYEKDVYNGDIGYVTGYDQEENQLQVDFEGRTVRYAPEDVDDLVLAYAITIHKSQGSEYPVVVVPMVMQHRIMLRRTLLYTAMTRAERMLVLLGQRGAVATAVQSPFEKPRYGRLKERLREALR